MAKSLSFALAVVLFAPVAVSIMLQAAQIVS